MRPRAGFTLTELLIAVSLLSVVTAGGIRAFARASASQRDSAAVQQLHERAQYVFATLEPELQMAGFLGVDAPVPAIAAPEVPAAAAQCGAEVVGHIDRAAEVLPAWSLPCAARNGGAVDDSQVLIIRRASAHLADGAEAGRAQWFADAAQPRSARVYWHGEAPWTRADASAGRALRDLLVRIYYVSRSADDDASTPALRVKSLTSIAGVPAFIDTEVMPGVESLQVELLPAAHSPQLARVALRLRPIQATAGAAIGGLDVSRVFSLRNAAR